MNIDEYIDQRLDAQIKWYSGKNPLTLQKMYKRSQIIEIVLASSIPLHFRIYIKSDLYFYNNWCVWSYNSHYRVIIQTIQMA